MIMATGAVWWYLRAPVGGGVVGDHPEVQVPALGSGDPALPCPVVHGERGQPRCHAEALLGAAVGDVDPPLVDLDGDAAERGDAVGQQQGVALAGVDQGGPDGSDVVAHPGAGLGVDRGHQFRVGVGGGQALGDQRLAPRLVHPDHLGAGNVTATSHIRSPNRPVDADDDDVTGADGVDEGRFHPRGTGAGDGEGQFVVRPPHLAQPVTGLVQQLQEDRVEVPEHGSGEGLGCLRIRVGRAGAHEDSLGVRHWPACYPEPSAAGAGAATRPGGTRPGGTRPGGTRPGGTRPGGTRSGAPTRPGGPATSWPGHRGCPAPRPGTRRIRSAA